MERNYFKKWSILLPLAVPLLFMLQCTQTEDELKFIQFVRFQKVTLDHVTDTVYSNENPSLVFGEIVEILDTLNDNFKVRSFTSNKEGWLPKYFLTSNKHEIDYLKEVNLFPKYLMVSLEGHETFTTLTNMPAEIDENNKVQFNWRKKGFSFYFEPGSIQNLIESEMGEKCDSLRPNNLFVYDGEAFSDIAFEASKYYSPKKYRIDKKSEIQSLLNNNRWYMRFDEKNILKHSDVRKLVSPYKLSNTTVVQIDMEDTENEIVDTLKFGDELELIDWDIDKNKLKVRTITSGKEGWIAWYYLTPNKYEIEFLKQKQLLPEGGYVYSDGNIIITTGARPDIVHGSLVSEHGYGFMVIFDGINSEQYCIRRKIPYNAASFSFYVLKVDRLGDRLIEVMPMATKQDDRLIEVMPMATKQYRLASKRK